MPARISPSEAQQPHETRDPSQDREFYVLEPGRADHVPTPLLMDNLYTHYGMTYYDAVRRKITNLLGLPGNDYDPEPEDVDDRREGVLQQPEWLRKFAFVALMGAVSDRFRHNRNALHAHEVQSAAQGIVLNEQVKDVVERAKRGTATTDELLLLPAEVPTLPAIEIAKLSHPFDWNATGDMDLEVNQAMRRQGAHFGLQWLSGDIVPDDPLSTEYLYRCNDNSKYPAALIVARKERIAVLGGSLLITNRSGHIIRFMEESGEEGTLDIPPELRKICFKLLAAKGNTVPDERVQASMKLAEKKLMTTIGHYIEEQLVLEPSERANWLNPTSTSYYSRPLKPEERLALESNSQAAQKPLGSAAVSSASLPQLPSFSS